MKSRRRKVILAVAAVVFASLFVAWQRAIHQNRSIPDEPFHIAGNLYYVGSTDVTSFLLTDPAGDILIDGGYPETAPLIAQSIAKLGFNIRNVKVILNTHAHFDHSGGLKALQDSSGAQLWISEGDAAIIASGGAWDKAFGPLRFFGVGRFPKPRIDHQFKDGDTVHVGATAVVAHITPGHTPGCTSWAFTVHAPRRDLLAVDVCSLTILPFMSLVRDTLLRDQFEHSLAKLRGIPADIFLGAHGSFFDLAAKHRAMAGAADSVAPFIDRSGYLAYIDAAEKRIREASRP